ncbi:MAG: hypothetical protein SGILL_004044 [Bacillariaceae sp.]
MSKRPRQNDHQVSAVLSTSNTSSSSTPGASSSAVRDAAAGALSGAFARTATAPIERVKLILQLQGSSKSKSTSTSPSVTQATPTSALSVTRQIYETEGFLAFWRGNSQNVIRAAGQAALNFALMEYYKNIAMAALTTPQSWMVSFLAGGMAGGTVTTVLYPTEFLRTRLALDLGGNSSQQRQYRGTWDATTQILRSDGIQGIYRGYGISLAGSVLYRLLYLGGYDAFKTEWHHWQLLESEKLGTDYIPMTWTERFFLAQFVSLSAGAICYPIDSVRRRMMMQAGKSWDQQLYHNSFQCFARIWSREGWRGFYLGFGPNVFRSIGGALALVAYDGFKAVMA